MKLRIQINQYDPIRARVCIRNTLFTFRHALTKLLIKNSIDQIFKIYWCTKSASYLSDLEYI